LYQVLLRAEYRTTGDGPAPAAEAAPAGEPAPAADPPRETAPAGVKGAAR
jgi:hypothetical protein